MISRRIAYLIAEVLYYKYGTEVDISEEQIEEEISVMAGDDQRTFKKYKEKLESCGYIIVTSPPPNPTWKIPTKPKRPLKPSEYLNYIKSL